MSQQCRVCLDLRKTKASLSGLTAQVKHVRDHYSRAILVKDLPWCYVRCFPEMCKNLPSVEAMLNAETVPQPHPHSLSEEETNLDSDEENIENEEERTSADADKVSEPLVQPSDARIPPVNDDDVESSAQKSNSSTSGSEKVSDAESDDIDAHVQDANGKLEDTLLNESIDDHSPLAVFKDDPQEISNQGDDKSYEGEHFEDQELKVEDGNKELLAVNEDAQEKYLNIIEDNEVIDDERGELYLIEKDEEETESTQSKVDLVDNEDLEEDAEELEDDNDDLEENTEELEDDNEDLDEDNGELEGDEEALEDSSRDVDGLEGIKVGSREQNNDLMMDGKGDEVLSDVGDDGQASAGSSFTNEIKEEDVHRVTNEIVLDQVFTSHVYSQDIEEEEPEEEFEEPIIKKKNKLHEGKHRESENHNDLKKKKCKPEETAMGISSETTCEGGVKRKRGRPRKHPRPTEDDAEKQSKSNAKIPKKQRSLTPRSHSRSGRSLTPSVSHSPSTSKKTPPVVSPKKRKSQPVLKDHPSRGLFCKLCGKTTHGQFFIRHAISVHLKDVPVYQCKKCDYGTGADWAIRAHVKTEHKSTTMELISDQRIQFRPQIDEMCLKCFDCDSTCSNLPGFTQPLQTS